MPIYARPLKVSTPDGKRIYAKIFQLGTNVKIEINYLEEVKKDDPPFAHNGVITITVPSEKYIETINLLTRYIEDLLLKGMADEDIYSGLGAKPNIRRVKKDDSRRKTGIIERERDSSSIYISSRGSESPESFGGRESDSEMAESSNSKDSGED